MKSCRVPICKRVYYAKTLCKVHYQRVLRHGSTDSLTNQKPKESHGMSLTTEYKSWTHMIQRCTNPRETGYQYWGGRGIKVCEEWRSSFLVFLADMGAKPTPAHTIDRIDNNGHYEPNNCRWATRQEQHQNQFHGNKYKRKELVAV